MHIALKCDSPPSSIKKTRKNLPFCLLKLQHSIENIMDAGQQQNDATLSILVSWTCVLGLMMVCQDCWGIYL